MFGIEEYKSTDIDDDRADYCLDLNLPVPDDMPRFDIVTDFGTAEHVYNISQVLDNMHRLLPPGGIALHCVPAFAFTNHGFYTPNPNLFIEFAHSNNYELIDFSYVDNMFVREKLLSSHHEEDLDFDSLPIQLEDMQDTQHFMTKLVLQYHDNIISSDTRRMLSELAPPGDADPPPYPSSSYHMCFVFDLVFVAMMKPLTEAPVVPPLQKMSGVTAMRQTPVG
jgi:SAM-dependent methyltransferase